ncbi:MAG: STAS domain-containing protein [Acidobacteriota bacterium]|nr:MAG: STAS domain-containing protein [Acidobacteriota bacterium]
MAAKVSVFEMPGPVLDASNSGEVKKLIAAALEESSNLVLDMSALNFVDSSGLGVILGSLRKANQAGGDIKLCSVTKPVRALMELVRMHRVVEIHNDREEAVRSF